MSYQFAFASRTFMTGPPFASCSTITRTFVERVMPPAVPRTVMSYVPGVTAPGRLIVTRATAPRARFGGVPIDDSARAIGKGRADHVHIDGPAESTEAGQPYVERRRAAAGRQAYLGR